MSQDLFRDTPVRYLGYANEIRKIFSFIPTRGVWFTYGVACAYIGCDVADKSINVVFNQIPTDNLEERRRNRIRILSAYDALVWQSLASVVLPGITMNRLRWSTNLLFGKAFKTPPIRSSKYISAFLVSLAIPLIIKPIDEAVDLFLDLTLRPWLYGTTMKPSPHKFESM